MVTRLDRLGRSLPHLLRLVETLTAHEVELQSLAEEINTTSVTGRRGFRWPTLPTCC